MSVSLALLAVAAASALGTGVVLRHAARGALLDVPNERSSHTTPTPRGGGVVFALLWLIGLPGLWLLGLLEGNTAAALAGGGAMIATVGWVDDLGHVHPGMRLLAHFTAAAWTLWLLGGYPEAAAGDQTLRLGWAGTVLAAVAIVWLVNLYNFMDGIDGLAGLEAVTAGIIVGTLLTVAGARGLAVLSFGIAAAAAGFLLWNWPPARIFMGDVGSGLLGYAFAAVAVAADRSAGVPAIVLLLPLGVFIADATYTLLRRVLRGERFYQAHRSHVYQRLVQAGWPVRHVDVLVLLLNVVLGVGAWIAWRWPGTALAVVAAAAMVLFAAGAVLLRVRPASTRA